MQQKGADVLVHPIRGRLPNMLLVSANLHTDAENINYVALDLTFKEATEMQPIFAFEDSLISKIDKLLLDLENLFDDGLRFWDSVGVFDLKSRLLGLWGRCLPRLRRCVTCLTWTRKNTALPHQPHNAPI